MKFVQRTDGTLYKPEGVWPCRVTITKHNGCYFEVTAEAWHSTAAPQWAVDAAKRIDFNADTLARVRWLASTDGGVSRLGVWRRLDEWGWTTEDLKYDK